ncbi:hypothetical protein [Paracoccus saliphilus]|uniref:Uncharacterized protein n=1 Tax=Paracoccus saliphilus TaxID=405559 RepID=A0AA45W6B2_9RHOB|nr:hypothetical protein [Paracoccus saliphilus]WCR04482.1 hypothetical protein JHX88_07090 [Paracoccus saliphilus]SIT00759.1 hypothetical protein SAMN05421772_11229 [Paracoccus saliphilus]
MDKSHNFSLVMTRLAWLVSGVPGPKGHRTGQPDNAEKTSCASRTATEQDKAERQGADFAADAA